MSKLLSYIAANYDARNIEIQKVRKYISLEVSDLEEIAMHNIGFLYLDQRKEENIWLKICPNR